MATAFIISLEGSQALSEFRRDKLLHNLQGINDEIVTVQAQYLHLLHVSEEPGPDNRKIVDQLLQYGPLESNSSVEAPHVLRFVTVPRIGTISPWSTKATDIFHHCGLTQVLRVERGITWSIGFSSDQSSQKNKNSDLLALVHDPMTESVLEVDAELDPIFAEAEPAPLNTIDIINGGQDALDQADMEFGFALSDEEKVYLVEQFQSLGRNPTDVELMMFAQVNSEHCRHKIFNADWTIDSIDMPSSLFSMIRTTHEKHPEGTLVAYKDNASILAGVQGERLVVSENHDFQFVKEDIPFTAKVETHNHPTAISPFAGAATGSGGEIRDEGATGRGGKPKAGLVGYTVSDLRHPEIPRSWEDAHCAPERIATPLQIMLDGPIGAAAFNNEFGRPNIAGYFRTYEQVAENDEGVNLRHAYHKPIMLAGGVGTVRPHHIDKLPITQGCPIVVLGGPTMLIGLGGGAASSVASGDSDESLDFASVQRGNPEMQRRCQEVIDACAAMGKDNPIVSIHDVGAGGLCNALPELVNDADKGGHFELRKVLNDEPGMNPMQIWCNESQERYVLAVDPAKIELFENLCQRERCLYAIVGHATDDMSLVLDDDYFKADSSLPRPIDLPMSLLFGLPPKMHRQVETVSRPASALDLSGLTISRALELVLTLPAVADKTFLVTIGDRSVTGLICRDQMVGPWQVPVADVGVTASSYRGYTGEAMSIGERTPVAVLDAPASGRLAIAEAITNMAAVDTELSGIKLSANWMVAAGEKGHDAALYETVQSITQDVCWKLGLSIPVGKDSMSMKSVWNQDGAQHKAVSPVSLVVSGFTAVKDVRNTLTPQLTVDDQETDLWLLDLGKGKNRLGGSALAQVLNQTGSVPADLDDAADLKQLFNFIQQGNQSGLILAYHDRSDGGAITTLCEMAFASRCGLDISLNVAIEEEAIAILFNEEPGAVIQIRRSDNDAVEQLLHDYQLQSCSYKIAQVVKGDEIKIESSASSDASKLIFAESRTRLHRLWSETTYNMQKTRDNPDCAQSEYDRLLDQEDSGLFARLTFNPSQDIVAPYVNKGARPKIAILREQGVNGQMEMAAAFRRAGFDPQDVTMTDLDAGLTLDEFAGLAACGGFSFGDVLGAGEGWAKSILFNSRLRDMMQGFFHRQDTFSLGVCNGCQMMSTIKELIPGAESWPKFVRNLSEQYEARFVMVRVEDSPSILLQDMQGSCLPVSVAHGEGRVQWQSEQHRSEEFASLRFVDYKGLNTEVYPSNPNGSVNGLTGFTSQDGRATIMMPHPERVYRTVANSWHPSDWDEDGAWTRIFMNARCWVD